MHITKVIVENYRTLKKTTVPLNEHLNIIVGDNECGNRVGWESVAVVVIHDRSPDSLPRPQGIGP